MSPDGPVRAAGGVIWRPSERSPGQVDVVLVHRPAYDDWSLPKGKADPGENDEDTARREIREETGLETELGVELPSTHYLDRFSQPKVVRYWAMVPVGGALKAHHEVDDAQWVPLDRARQMLSYPRDQAVLDALREAISPPD
ncbi:MAG: NUDIX hydrolase [Actinomycetota bacterium]|nr:NUDIX hydrolase [Actinomycetota bacterium]